MAVEIPVVRDHIIPIDKYPHLQETQTLRDAVHILLSFTCGEEERLRHSHIIILNDNNEFVGFLNLKTILRTYDKRLVDISMVEGHEGKGGEFPNLTILWEDSFFSTCSLKKDTVIKDFMLTADRFSKGSDSLLKALSMMLYADAPTLPVVEENIVIGVIRMEEIFKTISSQCKL
ncbi:MAG: CBS domain-containing protein [Thermodesulfobacteriota bacterium]|nr:CBS domain-containing protein [Thermodesulfobacteriota bacterium]